MKENKKLYLLDCKNDLLNEVTTIEKWVTKELLPTDFKEGHEYKNKLQLIYKLIQEIL